ncbi:RAMP superfamily CRISPR-associated protein [Pantanalinema rosaneae CENA516]|uniref:RAMP superfamily CRISPR-associated protein n=1 Tax=Pantanalinema rosaneae TaxID=1620701 RepID=UPI003D6F8CF1
MSRLQIRIQLLSDTTFGRGDGVAGLVDQEVEHDAYGFPYLRGRTLKGLLREECENLIAVLPTYQLDWLDIAYRLFGEPGSELSSKGILHVGDACLPQDLRAAVAKQIDIDAGQLTKTDILNSLTTIRRQTSIEALSGVPDKGSLRSARVIVRELELLANLDFEQEPTDAMKSLIAVGTLALRYVGSGRHRGRGHVRCTLHDTDGNDVTAQHTEMFGKELKSTEGA